MCIIILTVCCQSAGTAKHSKKKKAKEVNTKSVKKGGQQDKPYKQPTQKQEVQDDGTVDDEEPNVSAEVDMIDALTGIPVLEDELLFAVPVVAPYNTLINYK